ncbi:putative polyketide synthase [Seiridium unicorne]|uniref:Polyketide synthase n=1 Tax=Seiridium unicorne TaxID=138068 RepID=A0ABR2UEG2_9PEZI
MGSDSVLPHLQMDTDGLETAEYTIISLQGAEPPKQLLEDNPNVHYEPMPTDQSTPQAWAQKFNIIISRQMPSFSVAEFIHDKALLALRGSSCLLHDMPNPGASLPTRIYRSITTLDGGNDGSITILRSNDHNTGGRQTNGHHSNQDIILLQAPDASDQAISFTRALSDKLEGLGYSPKVTNFDWETLDAAALQSQECIALMELDSSAIDDIGELGKMSLISKKVIMSPCTATGLTGRSITARLISAS